MSRKDYKLLYFVQINPFLLGAEENPLVARVVTVALMRAFNTLLYRLGNKRRPQLQLEIISLQTILDYTGVTSDFLKDDRGRLNAFDQGITYEILWQLSVNKMLTNQARFTAFEI